MSQDVENQNLQIAIGDFRAGRMAEAEKRFREIISNQPRDPAAILRHAEAMHYLGVIAYRAGRDVDAEAILRQSIRLNPNNAEAHSNLAAVLKAIDQLDEAVAACRRAIAIDPNLGRAYTHLGNALSLQGKREEGVAAYEQAVRCEPTNAKCYSNLGGGLNDLFRLDEAVAAFERAIELRPDMAEAHWNLALTLLLKGDPRGWQECEWRWQSPRFSSPPRNFPQPMWRGEELRGRTILLHAEQGLGDVIQFVRLAALVAARGGKVVLECQKPLVRLLRNFPGVQTTIAAGEALPVFDVHCPLMSLPLALGIGLEKIPGDVPYLFPERDLVRKWETKLAPRQGKPRVGLCWLGNAKPNPLRSIPIEALRPLTQLEGFTFHSLQKDLGEKSVAPSGDQPIQDFSRELDDFADMAALMAVMDRVITIDTANAHLAGALGKPVWVLLPLVPDWRWRLEREDSPWYPTMRLFRQTSAGDWDEVIGRVAAALRASGKSDGLV